MIPKLIINGSNDRYWAVDALSKYWDGLAGPKWASIVPNAGHGLGDMKQALTAISTLAKSVAGTRAMPTPEWLWDGEGVRIDSRGAPPRRVRLWQAVTGTLDFRDATWREELVLPGTVPAYIALPECLAPQALLVEFEYEQLGGSMKLSAPVRVVIPERVELDRARFSDDL